MSIELQEERTKKILQEILSGDTYYVFLSIHFVNQRKAVEWISWNVANEIAKPANFWNDNDSFQNRAMSSIIPDPKLNLTSDIEYWSKKKFLYWLLTCFFNHIILLSVQNGQPFFLTIFLNCLQTIILEKGHFTEICWKISIWNQKIPTLNKMVTIYRKKGSISLNWHKVVNEFPFLKLEVKKKKCKFPLSNQMDAIKAREVFSLKISLKKKLHHFKRINELLKNIFILSPNGWHNIRASVPLKTDINNQRKIFTKHCLNLLERNLQNCNLNL